MRCLNSLSESSIPTESGIDSTCGKCDSCEELAKQVDKTRKECVQNILESKETIKNLEAEDLKKAALIKQLNFELKTAKEEITKVKKDLGVRNDQLKDKNKSVEKLKLSIDKIKSESENMQSNFNHKIDNLEKVSKNLHLKLQMKENEIKQERSKSRNKTKTKNSASQTLSSSESSNKEIQTVSSEHKNMETSTEEKFFIIGDQIKMNLYPLVQNTRTRSRCNSFPSRLTFTIKTSKIKTNVLNPKEAPWDAIDPDLVPNAASSLNLTRDIAGFFCAIANNMKRGYMIEDMMDELMNTHNSATEPRVIKKARRILALKDISIGLEITLFAPD